MSLRSLTRTLLVLAMLLSPAAADDKQKAKPDEAQPMTTEELVTFAKPSLAVITSESVRGSTRGVGTGFAIGRDLLATNLHVIGEGESFAVEMSDGRKLPVLAVHASDRFFDLAIIRVDVKDASLKPLSLATAKEQLKDGAPTVVMGNPHGLKNSVVKGVISGRRDVGGRRMIQLAIPVEPGNSGGPVLDMRGRVHGVVTLKSVVTRNLGFAMDVAALRELQAKPNSVSFANWQTIGALDKRVWKPLFGANWRRLGGRLSVRGAGKGFGGRSLCLFQTKPPKPPFEVAVSVKLDDEAGAAGLVVHADGGDRHYGFYPSNGEIRFSAFRGPSVYSWQVIHQAPSKHYRPGKWNDLKVRVEEKQILCYVNDELFYKTTNKTFTKGLVGLAKFRDTNADFKGFKLAKQIPSRKASPEQTALLQKTISELPDFGKVDSKQLATLATNKTTSVELLESQAEKLERQAAALRKVANDVHVRSVVNEMKALLEQGDDKFDLLQAALLIARLDDDEVDVAAYLDSVGQMATDLSKSFAKDAKAADKIKALNRYLFTENGYHGSRTEYNTPAKRYMNRVIDDRNGLPIMLSVLYMELGRRVGLKLEGVGMPGHFVVRHLVSDKENQLIDVFDNGKPIDRKQAAELVANTNGIELRDEHLAASSKREMVIRMLTNLRVLAIEKKDSESLLRYLELTLAVEPNLHTARVQRAQLKYLTGRRDSAIADLDWILEHAPEELPLEEIRQMRRFFLERDPPPAP